MGYKPPYRLSPLLPLVIRLSPESDCNQSLSKTKMSLPYQTFLCSTFFSNFIIFTHKLKLNHILNVILCRWSLHVHILRVNMKHRALQQFYWGKPLSKGTYHNSCSAQDSDMRSALSYYSFINTPKIRLYGGTTLHTTLLR
jgi:hypothetical protein